MNKKLSKFKTQTKEKFEKIEQEDILGKVVEQMEKDYSTHFWAIETDFDNVNRKIDMTIEGVNSMNSNIVNLEKEVLYLSSSW